MKKATGPVRDFSKIRELGEAIRVATKEGDRPAPPVDPAVQENLPDFEDTETTFAHRTDSELRQSARLFHLLNFGKLSDVLGSLSALAVKWRLPFAKWSVKNTIYKQFVGGESLQEAEAHVTRLEELGVFSYLDYGAEGKSREEDYNKTMKVCLRDIQFAAKQDAVPVVITKISALARFGLLEDIQRSDFSFDSATRTEYKTVLKRLDAICGAAAKAGVTLFIDAEESWIQDTIDHLVTLMMRRYNRDKAIVFNTFQFYRHDRLHYLTNSYDRAKSGGYLLGAKLVRGAYMVKERKRAEELGIPSPIQADKQATDSDFNAALRFCLDHYQEIAFCNASHNQDSAKLMARIIVERGLPRRHPHLAFCQLYGMSDDLTFNLAKADFNVAKYLVYGPVREVLPYLTRRAQENTTVTKDMGREYRMVVREIGRRKGEKQD